MNAPQAATPRVHVLAPVHNRRAITERFIRCLLAQTYTNWHLILIDDGSTDGTADMARALVPSLTVLTGKGNWWWAGSLQQGFKWLKRNGVAADDVVLLINDDTEFEPDFITAGVAALKPRSLLLSQLYRCGTGEFVEVGCRWDWPRLECRGVKDPAEANCFATRGLFQRLSDMIEIGGFHPWLLPHYLSDYEYTLRARRRGFALDSAPGVRLRYHHHLTGFRENARGSVREVLRNSFSLRSTSNPLYWTTFVILACPMRYVPRHIRSIWKNFLRNVRNAYREQRLGPAVPGNSKDG